MVVWFIHSIPTLPSISFPNFETLEFTYENDLGFINVSVHKSWLYQNHFAGMTV